MSQQIIDVGTAPNNGTGDPIRTAFILTNNNFSQLFSLPNSTPPTSNIGNTGDVPGMYAWSSEFFYYCYGSYNGNTAIWGQVERSGIVSNGNSNVVISSANSNIVINVSGVANVATFTPTGLSVTGNLSAGNISTGNLTAANFLYPNGNSIISSYSNLNVANYLPTYSGNLGNTGNGLAYVFSNNYFYGNGQPFVTYGNVDVAAYLPTYTGVLGPAGAGLSIIYANSYRYGNGVLVGNYSNANVTAYLPTNTSNVNANNISATGIVSATGNIYTAGYFVGNFQGNVSGNLTVPGSNTQVLFNGNGNAAAVAGLTYDSDSNTLAVLGVVTAQGNVYGNNILANGYYYANGTPFVSSNYGNSNVADYLTTYTGNITADTISTTGNITTYSISTTGTGGNITGANVILANNISALANVTADNVVASFLYGNGSYLTGLSSGYTNSNVAAYLPTYTGNLAGNNITVTSNVGAGNVNASLVSATGNIYTDNYFVGNFVGNISGNLTVPGSNTQVLFNNNGNAGAVAGLTYNSLSNILSVTGLVTAVRFSGEAGNLSNITAGNVTGTVGNATYATTAGTAGTANTVLVGAQPNITSVGALNSLTVTGNVVAGNISTAGTIAVANISTTGSGGDISGANLILSNSVSTSGNVTVGGLLSSPQQTKASNDLGSVGQICWDSTYIYVCTASNTWKRVALTGGY